MTEGSCRYRLSVGLADGALIMREYGSEKEAMDDLSDRFDIAKAKATGFVRLETEKDGRRTVTVLNADHIVSVRAEPLREGAKPLPEGFIIVPPQAKPQAEYAPYRPKNGARGAEIA